MCIKLLGMEYGESYSDELFAEWYKQMVKSLPKEYEVGVDVEYLVKRAVELSKERSKGKAESSDQSPIVLLDIAGGDGRIAHGVVEGAKKEGVEVVFGLLDLSPVMVAAAREANVKGGHYFVGNMAYWPQELVDWVDSMGGAHLAVIGAGSIHHLTNDLVLQAAMWAVQAALLPRRGTLVLTSMTNDQIEPETEIFKKPDDPVMVGEWSKVDCSARLDKGIATTKFELTAPDGRRGCYEWALRVMPDDFIESKINGGEWGDFWRLRSSHGNFKAAMDGDQVKSPKTVFILEADGSDGVRFGGIFSPPVHVLFRMFNVVMAVLTSVLGYFWSNANDQLESWAWGGFLVLGAILWGLVAWVYNEVRKLQMAHKVEQAMKNPAVASGHGTETGVQERVEEEEQQEDGGEQGDSKKEQ